MRLALLLLCGYGVSDVPGLAQPIKPAAPDELPILTPAEKYKWHVQRLVRPTRLATIGAGAALMQWRDVPAEWPQGAGGYAQRYAAGLAYAGTRNLMAASLHSSLGTDPRYRRSRETGFSPRFRHVLQSVFVARGDDGSARLPMARFGSAYGTAFLASTWLPESHSGASRALRRGTRNIGFDILNNTIAEFAPELFRKFRRKP